ncbi:MAG: PepSY domain-containing protein [Synergistaceae bacterium]|nr:PepSY domain-containing protein [Synergistaceae bacterium]
MKKFLCALMLMVLAVSGAAFAQSYEEETYVREEAAKRNMKLITLKEVQRIATERIGKPGVTFKEIELEDEDDYYTTRQDFKPVWTMEAIAGGQKYKIDIDAVTGEVLKFKLDD